MHHGFYRGADRVIAAQYLAGQRHAINLVTPLHGTFPSGDAWSGGCRLSLTAFHFRNEVVGINIVVIEIDAVP